MKSPSEITTIANESSLKLSSVTDQVSNSTIANNNTEQKCTKLPSEITTITNELSTNSITKNNTEQIYMNSPSEINTITNKSSTKLFSVTNQVSNSKSPDPTLINNNDSKISTLKRYDPSKYYNFDSSFGDNNNIETYVRRNITLKICVEGAEDSNKIESMNLLSSNCFINDIRDWIVKFNSKYVYTR